MKRLCLILILALFSYIGLLANVRVLSIGISEYPESSGWNKLNAHNDVLLIKAVFPSAISLEDNQATLYGIKDLLSNLSNTAAKGDTIIIHFSGHGQQILTRTSNDEIDGVDEAIIPYNAGKRKTTSYRGENHLTDNSFGIAIDRFRRTVGPKGLVIAVIDACHSDSMDKTADDAKEIYRGTDEIFGAENLPDEKIDSLREAYHNQDSSALATFPDMSNVIYISACRSDQRNYEVVEDGKGYGSLTYYFSEAYRRVGLLDMMEFLTTIYSGMQNDKTLQFHGQVPSIRNTIGWEAPVKIIPLEPQPQSPPTTPEGNRITLWIWSLIVLIPLIIVISLWITKKR